MKKRILASFLSLVLVLSLVPASALATEEQTGPETPVCAGLEGCTEDAHDPACPLYVAPGGDNNAYYEFEDVTTLGAPTALTTQADDEMSGTCGAADSESSVTWALTANGGKVTVDNEEKDAYTLTISGTGAMADITYNWKDQDTAPWARYRSQITEIVIGEGITYIGKYAFIKTAIQELNLSGCANLTVIGERAFSNIGNGFTKVVFPNSLKEIGSGAFSAAGFTEVDLTNCTNLHTLNSESFSYCRNLRTVKIEQCSSLTKIGNSCFTQCPELADITLPNGTKTVGTNAFSYTGLTRVDWSNLTNLESIGGGAFSNNANLTVVSLAGCSSLRTIGAGAFSYSNVVAVDITGCNNFKQAQYPRDFDGLKENSVVYSSKALNLRPTEWDIIGAVTNGGSFAKDTDFEAGKLATPTKEGYIFAGWYTADGKSDNWGNKVTSPAADNTYYAKWVREITFNANGGEGTMPAQQITEGDTSTKLTANTFTKTGYTFTGWNTKADGTGVAYEDKAGVPAASTTLYAQWTPNTYTINFNANGGSGTMNSIEATYDSVVKLPANQFTKTDAIFAGWATKNEEGTTVEHSDGDEVENLTAEPNGTVTLYALWTQKDVLNPDVTPQTKTYNGQVQGFMLDGGFTITYEQDGEAVSAPMNAGVYDVMIHKDATGTTATYQHTVHGGLTIEKAQLTVKADNQSIRVGESLPTSYSYTVSGWQGNDVDNADNLLTDVKAFCSDASNSKEGTYTITVSGTASIDNYKITYVNGTLTVIKRSSGGGSSSSGSSSGDYIVSVDSDKHGTVTVSPKRADKGDTVTITVRPDKGYELDELTVTDKSGDTVKLKDKGNGKFTFTMPGSKVTVEASFKQIDAEPDVPAFADVPADAYYADAVVWAVKEGITTGTGANTFGPDLSCTRAQMVTFLWRANGSPKATGVNPFADVSADAYYYDAVLWAAEQGVTSGTSANTFSPDAVLTRGQAVTFLWRVNGAPAVSGGSFGDVAPDAWYANAVAWAVSEGVTSGTGGNNFSPDAPCTRAQTVTFMYRDAK